MKLLCTSCVVNRQLVTLGNQKLRHIQSTLALCKQPKSEEYCFILFSAQSKNGTKYTIKDNILQVLTRFLNDGKITIKFKKPEHDIFVQADTIQLKSFLRLLQLVLQNKAEDLKLSSMAVTPINRKIAAPKKLVIMKRSDYPLHGFPRTIEILQINDINRSSLDRGILQLCKLRILDLSNNLIEYLPEEFNKLPSLLQLNVSKNLLGKSGPRKWDWMGGNLSKTLLLLDLSDNEMKYLPDQIVRLHKLVTLHVDRNELKKLPSGIGNLRNLKFFSASINSLTSLPGSVKKWQLDELDLYNNSFQESEQSNPAAIFPKPLPVCSLKECAARKVLLAQCSYDSETLPMTLIRYLELAKYCVCGKACFHQFIQHSHMLFLSSVARNFSVSNTGIVFVPMDCYFCSLKCFSSSNYTRNRQPII